MLFPKPRDLSVQRTGVLPSPDHQRGSRFVASGFFLRGPVPLAWLASAATLRGRSIAVGVLIWFMVGLKKSTSVSIPTQRLREFGIDRYAFYRSLAALERAGLVTVERRRGAQARVAVVVDEVHGYER
jgi:hypothetical protein